MKQIIAAFQLSRDGGFFSRSHYVGTVCTTSKYLVSWMMEEQIARRMLFEHQIKKETHLQTILRRL